ncbi:hypothetical protein SKAU_G00059280 [Synaphobranchus kaupii]|uniref:Uncharacterized protein n=1 Tax=Synaphobranchus kaupii TaxID=118154 RepID=A0A9Q1JA73_SYNKA|nr:hypothetical protein SKAU_G00059280 [Synaphobranchus kaupii]
MSSDVQPGPGTSTTSPGSSTTSTPLAAAQPSTSFTSSTTTCTCSLQQQPTPEEHPLVAEGLIPRALTALLPPIQSRPVRRLPVAARVIIASEYEHQYLERVEKERAGKETLSGRDEPIPSAIIQPPARPSAAPPACQQWFQPPARRTQPTPPALSDDTTGLASSNASTTTTPGKSTLRPQHRLLSLPTPTPSHITRGPTTVEATTFR